MSWKAYFAIALIGLIGLPEYVAGKDIRGAGVKEVILKEAREKLERYFDAGEYRFEVSPRWIPQRLLQQDPATIESIELKGQVQRYMDFEVLYRYRGSRERTDIQLAVKVEQKLPVAARRITKGEEIKEEDLNQQWVSLFQMKGKLIEEADLLKGKVLRRTLLAGQPFRTSTVSQEYVIEAGDQVKLIMENRGVRIQLMGEARESGAKGDEIKIYSDETRRKYRAEVISPGVTKWKNTF